MPIQDHKSRGRRNVGRAQRLRTAGTVKAMTADAVRAAAIGAGADLIVSGDVHLLNLEAFQGIDIVTAATADGRINPAG